MAIPETILREIIDASTPEHSDMPYVKAKYLMIGMSIDLGEYFVKLKAEIDNTFVAPDLIDTAELERIIHIATDEWLDVTSVVADTTNNTITIDTDNPAVPPLRLPENRCVMVLVGDDASKSGYAAPTTQLTFADYLDTVTTNGRYNIAALRDFIYNNTGPDPQSFMRVVQTWADFHGWLNAHNAPEHIIAIAAPVWGDYKDTAVAAAGWVKMAQGMLE